MACGVSTVKVALQHLGRDVEVVLVAHEEGGYRCEVRGESFWVQVAAELSYAVIVDGREHYWEAVLARDGERICVALDGEVYEFTRGASPRPTAARLGGSGRVVAPMPGKVVAVLVAAGDKVSLGDPVVTLEAMKMESTLGAGAPGTVKAVHVSPGAMVDGGELLAEIEPEPTA